MIGRKYRFSALAGIAVAPLLALQPALASSGGGHSSHGSHGTHGSHHAAASETIRTVEIVAKDIEFSLSKIDVKPGETVRFVVRNDGELEHDFTIGDAATQEAHRAEMQAMMSGMADNHGHDGHVHGAQNAVMIKPGATAELIWTFGNDTDILFGCNVPGHYEAGMAGEFDIQS